MITFEEACDIVLEVFEKEWRTASDLMRTERLEKRRERSWDTVKKCRNIRRKSAV